MAKKLPLEARRRLEKLQDAIEESRVNPSPEKLRLMRVVEALESLETAAAKTLLEHWARGSSGLVLTDEANAALANLKRRPASNR